MALMQIQSMSQKTYRTSFGIDVPIIDTSDYNKYKHIASGQNGLIEVYCTPDDKFRAIKTLHAHTTPSSMFDQYLEVNLKEQMDLELRACLFNHPSIIKIHGINLENNQLIMNWYQSSLSTLPLSTSRNRRFSILYELADALAIIHDKGIIHSDIKPDNILLSCSEEAILTDFGSSLLNDQKYRYGLVRNPEKYIYCSPEKITGKQVDISTDIFSLGILAYAFYLSNNLNTAIGFMKLRGEIPSLHHFATDEDREVCAGLTRCVSLDKGERPSAIEIRHILGPRATREKQEIAEQQRTLLEAYLKIVKAD